MKNKNVIVIGGDGFCGWPTALYLSQTGCDVTIVDNLIRRKIDIDLGCQSLTPIKSIEDRLGRWKQLTGKTIDFKNIDVSDQYYKLLQLIKKKKPEAIVHFAEQRAAPMSMKSPFWKRYTVNNNINCTHNIMCAVVESGLDIHIVHLGTTGSAGYITTPMDIPEGYIDVKVQTDNGEEKMEFPWPLHSPSIYHFTKSADFLMFDFYTKNDKIKCTDLRQGIVWGCQTKQTELHKDLINRWDYDGDYGTVFNRFLIQSQTDHPLTVHGTGGQTRAFIHIQNTVQCIKMAIVNAPNPGKVRVLNQVTECLNVNNLAKLVSKKTGAEIRYYDNPREEAKSNDLRFNNKGLIDLGLKPITLEDGLMYDIMNVAKKYKDRVDMNKVICTSLWNKNKRIDKKGKVK